MSHSHCDTHRLPLRSASHADRSHDTPTEPHQENRTGEVVTQPSIDLEPQYHVGDIVELHAEICTAPCESDCGCRAMVARNGHQGAVLNVQPPLFGGEPYYQVDGIDGVLYGYELRAVQP